MAVLLDFACRETAFGTLVPPGGGLTALAAYGDEGNVAMLARAYDPLLGVVSRCV
jgi:hypothetical protein